MAITSAHVTVVVAGRLDDALRIVLAAGKLVDETGERMEEAKVYRWRREPLKPEGGCA